MWVEYWSLGEKETAYSPSEEEIQKAHSNALEFFGKEREYSDILARLERERMAKEKFNGNRVREWTGAEGRRLGVLMRSLKEDGRVTLERVREMSEEEIKGVVLDIWKRMQS
jgi:hypothetical protein